MGFGAKFKDFKIQNIVANREVSIPIRLGSLMQTPGFRAMDGRFFQLHEGTQDYTSGKVVIIGAKFREDMHNAFEIIYPALTELFRKVV